MKTIFFISILLACLLLAKNIFSEKPIQTQEARYQNYKQQYEIQILPGFKIQDEISELLLVEKSDARMRINAGCFDFGTENLVPVAEVVYLNGIPALKEDYYEGPRLKLRHVTLNRKDGLCFSLEEIAQDEGGWQELAQLRKTFRFIDN